MIDSEIYLQALVVFYVTLRWNHILTCFLGVSTPNKPGETFLIKEISSHPTSLGGAWLLGYLSTLQSLECQTCQLGKHHRATFVPRSVQRASSPFELVHSDIWDPSRTPSLMGFHYFVTFVDNYSRLHGCS